MTSVLLGLVALTACSDGSSGGAGGFATSAQLLEIRFPDPNNQNKEPILVPPQKAPLNQQIQFVFSGSPNPSQVNSQRLSVRDRSGFPVPGSYDVVGNVVTFTPALSTRPITQVSASSWDTGGAGLQPGVLYEVQAGRALWPEFVTSTSAYLRNTFPDPSGVDAVLLGMKATTGPNRFLKGIPKKRPKLIAVSPADGMSGLSPNLYSDPAGLFPVAEPYIMDFDAAIHPDPLNLDVFAFVDLDDTTLGPSGLPLGIDVTVLVNEIDFARVQVQPTGILPFDHAMSMQYPTDVRGLSMTPAAAPGTTVAATYTTAAAPAGTVSDALTETYDDQSMMERDTSEIQIGQIPASWDRLDSDVLEASFAFNGSGVLGRFEPSVAFPVVTFDTSVQVFPFADGSTPDAPPGYTVIGGIFEFTDIDIPAGVTIQARGPNPLIFSATGSVRIAGTIDLDGQIGTDDNAFDSAVTSVPGGPAGSGGGRGGEGHPIIYAGGQISNLTLVSPPVGGRGWGPGDKSRTGGFGGQGGMLDKADANGDFTTDHDILCTELNNKHNNGWRGAGGGGGSLGSRGKRPTTGGRGNVLADGLGGWIVRTKADFGPGWNNLDSGKPGDKPFADVDPNNDFIGLKGEVKTPIGGQGGGSGGSGFDAYFCGEWCLTDTDTSNDLVCVEGGTPEFGWPPAWAGSVGDTRGGGGGGGGGCFSCEALGTITVESTATITCEGGRGGGGEALGCGNWGGCGAGGSGGAILLESAVDIIIQNNATLNVTGGQGRLAVTSKKYITSCGTRDKDNQGTGGRGDRGLVQLQVPLGKVAQVTDPNDISPPQSWIDQTNTLNPAEFSAVSVGQSVWYDMGRTIARGGGAPTFTLAGIDANGFVITDGNGNVQSPNLADIRCDYLGQEDPLNPGNYLPGEEPRSDFIPTNATVKVEFQGADAITPGSKEVDPATIVPGPNLWSPSASVADGMQFIRYRITFDIDAIGSGQVGPTTPRPAVQWLNTHADF